MMVGAVRRGAAPAPPTVHEGCGTGAPPSVVFRRVPSTRRPRGCGAPGTAGAPGNVAMRTGCHARGAPFAASPVIAPKVPRARSGPTRIGRHATQPRRVAIRATRPPRARRETMQFARASLRERAERARSHRLRAITRGSRLAPGLLTTATVGWVPIFAATTSRTIRSRAGSRCGRTTTRHTRGQPSRKKFLVFVAKVGRCNLERFGESRSVWVTSLEMWSTPAVSRSSVTNEAERNVPPASARGAQLTRASPRPAPHGKVPRGRERIHREGCLARRELARGALFRPSLARRRTCPRMSSRRNPKPLAPVRGASPRASRAAPMTR